MKYKIWNKTDTLITPIGEVLTAEQVMAKYPMSAIEGFDFIICDAPITLGVFMEVKQTRETYKPMIIGVCTTDTTTEAERLSLETEYDTQSDAEFLDTLTWFEENPMPSEATAEERIAAALEFQNLLMLPDAIVWER